MTTLHRGYQLLDIQVVYLGCYDAYVVGIVEFLGGYRHRLV
jgi:hypothetical protein